MRVLIILAVMAMIPISTAGLFDILDEQYISDISELPYSPGSPSISWQESRNIKGWIDITGWRNLSRDGEKYFILGDPSSLAIVQYGTQSILDCNYAVCQVNSIEKNITINQSGNKVIARLHTVMKWTRFYQDQVHHIEEEADFYDSEVIPDQFETVLNPRINITEYNNTIEPKISISITGINNSGISLFYGNKSLTHSSKSYHVERTEKGIYYANASDIEAWDIKGQGIARLSDLIIINTNLSSMDYSQLDIRLSSLYGSVKVDPANFNISRVTYQPETVVYNPVLYSFLGIFLTLIGSAFYLFNRVIL